MLRSHVTVADLNGENRTVLFSGLEKPRGIVVDPTTRYMYMCDRERGGGGGNRRERGRGRDGEVMEGAVGRMLTSFIYSHPPHSFLNMSLRPPSNFLLNPFLFSSLPPSLPPSLHPSPSLSPSLPLSLPLA